MTTTQIERFLRPEGIEQAWELLAGGDPAVRPVSGGTDLTIACPPEVTTLVDLSGAVSREITVGQNGELHLGAMVTLTEMAEHPEVAKVATGVIPEMLADVGSPLLRNACTLGGHLARGKLSDVIPVMMAIDAEVTVHSDSDRRMALVDYYDHGIHEQPHILTTVHLPVLPEPSAAAFLRFARTAYDFPMANCAVRLSGNGEVRIVVGATPQRGLRASGAEAVIAAGRPDEATFEEAAEAAAGEIPTGSSWVVGAEYRSQLVRVLVGRCLAIANRRLEEA